MSRPAELSSPGRSCSSRRRCRKRSCSHCGPIRADDEWRKFHDNLVAYGGRVMLVSVTAPGDDVLPWDANVCGNDDHKHSGPLGCRVHEEAAYAWNVTASARYARLFKAATVSADRLLRRWGYRGRMPRRVAVVWSEQARGIWHVHEALPAGSELERAWSRQLVEFIAQADKREKRMPAAERLELLDLERLLEQPTRGFYGWGFVDRNPLRRDGSGSVTEGHARAARYLARNVAGYLVKNVQAEASKPSEDESTITFQGRRMVRRGTGEVLDGERTAAVPITRLSSRHLPGRALRGYVSVRLTMQTGVTMRNLRRARYLWVCLTHRLELPTWPDAELERVWVLLAGQGEAAARAP